MKLGVISISLPLSLTCSFRRPVELNLSYTLNRARFRPHKKHFFKFEIFKHGAHCAAGRKFATRAISFFFFFEFRRFIDEYCCNLK